jgi:hypothetical protein
MDGNVDVIGRLAARQHGVVSWQQLVEEGVDRHAIQRRLEDGTLYRVHRGVYAVGHPGRSTHADYMAAVLACGDGAALSHRAAAHLQRLLRGSPPRPEVTVPSTAGRSRKGIVIHRVRSLPAKDTKTVYGIRVTNVPRTLLDLAPLLPRTNVDHHGDKVDCHWPQHDLTIELVLLPDPSPRLAPRLRTGRRPPPALEPHRLHLRRHLRTSAPDRGGGCGAAALGR